jgi:hypothetical protein
MLLGPAQAAEKGSFVVGVSNAFINPHRVEQVADIQATASGEHSRRQAANEGEQAR